jgi:hypothetical protein
MTPKSCNGSCARSTLEATSSRPSPPPRSNADEGNYPLIRPLVVSLRKKYPDYNRPKEKTA